MTPKLWMLFEMCTTFISLVAIFLMGLKAFLVKKIISLISMDTFHFCRLLKMASSFSHIFSSPKQCTRSLRCCTEQNMIRSYASNFSYLISRCNMNIVFKKPLPAVWVGWLILCFWIFHLFHIIIKLLVISRNRPTNQQM